MAWKLMLLEATDTWRTRVLFVVFLRKICRRTMGKDGICTFFWGKTWWKPCQIAKKGSWRSFRSYWPVEWDWYVRVFFSAWIHESISGKDRFTSTERFAMGHGILRDTVGYWGYGMVGIEEPGKHLILWVPNFNQNANSFLSEATKRQGVGSQNVSHGGSAPKSLVGFMDRNAGALLFTWKIAVCDGCSFPSYEKILQNPGSFDLSPYQNISDI